MKSFFLRFLSVKGIPFQMVDQDLSTHPTILCMIFVKMLQEFILVKTFHNLIKERLFRLDLWPFKVLAFQSLNLLLSQQFYSSKMNEPRIFFFFNNTWLRSVWTVSKTTT